MSDYQAKHAHDEVIGAMEIRISQLADMSASDQLEVMREWFLDNFEDPVHSLPYESREGGYIWIDGGPYDAHNELSRKFSEYVADDVIQTLGDELSSECPEWAAQVDLSEDEIYVFEYTDQPTEHFREYTTAMEKNHALLHIDVPATVQDTFYGMIFVNLITIMETYLSDTFLSLILGSDKHLRKFVATTPEFKKRKLSIAQVYDSLDNINEIPKSYLKDFVWHRLSAVKKMYEATFDISFPKDLGPIYHAIHVRHALVHRNGRIDEETVRITKVRVQELAIEIDLGIRAIAEQINHLDDDDILLGIHLRSRDASS